MSGDSAAARLASSTPGELAKATEAAIVAARAGIEQVKAGGEVMAVLEAFDEATAALADIGDLAGTVAKAHPDEAMRLAADATEQAIEKVSTDISLDRGVYDALAALDISGADAPTTPLGGHDAAGLPACRRGPRRRHPGPDPGAERGAARAGAGLRPQHPHRHAHRRVLPRRRWTACRRTTCARTRRARTAWCGSPRSTPTSSRSSPTPATRPRASRCGGCSGSAATRPTSRCCGGCWRAGTSWPRCWATRTGRRTPPRTR